MLSQLGQGVMEQWTEAHPHLAELARLHRCLEEAFTDAVGVPPCVHPDAAEGQAQVPAPTAAAKDELPLLLHHRLDAAFLTQAGGALLRLMEALPAEGLPAPFLQECVHLRERLGQSATEAVLAVETILTGCRGGSRTAPTVSPLLAFLIWKLLTKLLASWREDLEQRLPELAWEEPICPLCGAGPSMAQLVRTSTGRKRLLVCGCCAMRWEYKRIGCPHCGNEEQSQLSIIEPEDEPFRIDCCQQCKGYIKTYTGKDGDGLMLADWSSLHLDALAMQQGWQRQAESLYSL